MDAGLAGGLPVGFHGRLQRLELGLCGRGVGELGRGGVVQRAADRAGRTILEHLRQDARLLVQKGPLHPVIPLPQLG